MNTEHRIGFHEATVAHVSRIDSKITLSLEGVRSGNLTRPATIRLDGVRSIIRDGIKVDDLLCEHEDGEVLTLEQTPTGIQLIVEWTDFQKHESITRSYRIECDSVEIEVH